MPEILGAGHVALTVCDVVASARWYEALFGWRMVRQSDAREDGRSLRTLFDPRTSLAVSLCGPSDRPGDRFDPQRTGLDHLALRVSDEDELNRWVERLDELHIERSPMRHLGEAVRYVTFEDPDGIRLEFFTHLNPTA